jgi:type IV pilus assembly protein PilA
MNQSPRQAGSTMKRDKGFTLIELMAVVAILSILSVIALAAYTDYIVRSKVGEGLSFAAEAKTSVSEYYYSTKKWPAPLPGGDPDGNAAAGLPSVAQYEASSFNHLHYIQITSIPKPGSITIRFKIPGTKADNKDLQMIPNTADGVVSWTCYPPDDNGIAINQVPPTCRGG